MSNLPVRVPRLEFNSQVFGTPVFDIKRPLSIVDMSRRSNNINRYEPVYFEV